MAPSSHPYSCPLERDTRSCLCLRSHDSECTSGWELRNQFSNDCTLRKILESGMSREAYVRIWFTSSSATSLTQYNCFLPWREDWEFLPCSLSLSLICFINTLREKRGSVFVSSSYLLDWSARGRCSSSSLSMTRRFSSSTASSSCRYRSTLAWRNPYFLAMRKLSSLLIKAANWG